MTGSTEDALDNNVRCFTPLGLGRRQPCGDFRTLIVAGSGCTPKNLKVTLDTAPGATKRGRKISILAGSTPGSLTSTGLTCSIFDTATSCSATGPGTAIPADSFVSVQFDLDSTGGRTTNPDAGRAVFGFQCN